MMDNSESCCLIAAGLMNEESLIHGPLRTIRKNPMQPEVRRDPNTNFNGFVITQVFQAMGDQDSFALGYNQSFMTNT